MSIHTASRFRNRSNWIAVRIASTMGAASDESESTASHPCFIAMGSRHTNEPGRGHVIWMTSNGMSDEVRGIGISNSLVQRANGTRIRELALASAAAACSATTGNTQQPKPMITNKQNAATVKFRMAESTSVRRGFRLHHGMQTATQTGRLAKTTK